MDSIPGLWLFSPLNWRQSVLVIIGIMIMGVGVFSIWLRHAGVPDRAALTQISGVLESATKVTHKRASSTYEFSIRTAEGELVKLTLPEREIREDTVRSLLRRPIVALYSDDFTGDKGLWELTSGNTRIVDYQVIRQRRTETQAFAATVGPCLGGGGLLLSLLGVYWLVRQRRATAPA